MGRQFRAIWLLFKRVCTCCGIQILQKLAYTFPIPEPLQAFTDRVDKRPQNEGRYVLGLNELLSCLKAKRLSALQGLTSLAKGI
eukprot:6180709-Pleurochrysis_carterae.AAC.1